MFLTSESKKSGQITVVYHYWNLSRFFLTQTLDKSFKSSLTLGSFKQNRITKDFSTPFYLKIFFHMGNFFLWKALQMPKYRMIGPLPYLYIFWYIGGRGWIRNFLWTLNCPLNWLISKSTDICKLWIFFFFSFYFGHHTRNLFASNMFAM